MIEGSHVYELFSPSFLSYALHAMLAGVSNVSERACVIFCGRRSPEYASLPQTFGHHPNTVMPKDGAEAATGLSLPYSNTTFATLPQCTVPTQFPCGNGQSGAGSDSELVSRSKLIHHQISELVLRSKLIQHQMEVFLLTCLLAYFIVLLLHIPSFFPPIKLALN